MRSSSVKNDTLSLNICMETLMPYRENPCVSKAVTLDFLSRKDPMNTCIPLHACDNKGLFFSCVAKKGNVYLNAC